MIILGIDPGTATTGYGLIEAELNRYRLIDYGSIRTPAKAQAPRRLEMIYDAMVALLMETKPDHVAIEQLFFNRNITTAVPVGQARGVILLACQKQHMAISEYTPLQVKQSIVGYGRADKKQIQFMVGRLLKMKEPPKNDDAADALAIAITHAHYYATRRVRGEEKA